MNKEFVKLTKNDFIEWANRFFGENRYDFSQVKTGNEIVRHVTGIHGLEIHIHTTLDTKSSFTRDLGKDAIHIVLFDRFGGNVAYTAPKILVLKVKLPYLKDWVLELKKSTMSFNNCKNKNAFANVLIIEFIR